MRHERQVGIAMLTNMVKLLQNSGAMRVHRVGNFAEMGDDFIVAMAEVAARQYRGRMHRHRLDHDHRRAADGAFFVIAAMALAGQAQLGHVGGMGAEDDAVVETAMAQLQGQENIAVLGHGNSLCNANG